MRAEQLEAYVRTYPGGRAAFVKAVGITEGRLSQIIGGDRASPDTALQIHKITNGKVPGSYLRPDLWRRARDVPVERIEAAE